MYSVLKAFCVAIYLLVVAGFVFMMPPALNLPLQLFAGTMLLVHALEAAIFIRHVRLYKGPMAVSLLLGYCIGSRWPMRTVTRYCAAPNTEG